MPPPATSRADPRLARLWPSDGVDVGVDFSAPRRWDEEAAHGGVERVLVEPVLGVLPPPPAGDADPPRLWAAIWATVVACPHLDWLITLDWRDPRPAMARLPAGWGEGWPWIRLGAAVAGQNEAADALGFLARLPARRRFLRLLPDIGTIGAGTIDLAAAGVDRCPSCAGSGARADDAPTTCMLCPRCLGSGHLARPIIDSVITGVTATPSRPPAMVAEKPARSYDDSGCAADAWVIIEENIV